MRGIAVFAAALALSLALNAALFAFLPVMTYLRGIGGFDGKPRETRLVALPVMPRKKDKPKPKESDKPAERKAPQPGEAVARQRFVMDLGVGGGSGAAVAGGVKGQDLEQMTFEEGEAEVEAKPVTPLRKPETPKKAVAAGAGGLVRCMLTIGEDGRLAHIEFLEVPGSFGFEEAVKAALKDQRFTPAMDGGIPVRMKMEQSYKF